MSSFLQSGRWRAVGFGERETWTRDPRAVGLPDEKWLTSSSQASCRSHQFSSISCRICCLCCLPHRSWFTLVWSWPAAGSSIPDPGDHRYPCCARTRFDGWYAALLGTHRNSFISAWDLPTPRSWSTVSRALGIVFRSVARHDLT